MRYAVVTGTASGIGKEVARLLNDKGFTVFGLDIDIQPNGGLFKSFVCDVSDEKQVAWVVGEILNVTSQIDCLINCAGMLTIGNPLLVKDMSFKMWDALIRINLRSVLVTTKLFYELLRCSDNSVIINLSSEQSYSSDVGFSPYAVSKAGINHFTHCCAKEFLKDGIRVLAIAFGTVKTGILQSFCDRDVEKELFRKKEEIIPFGIMTAVHAAEVVVDLLDEKYGFMTGEVVRIDGGYHLMN